jgi:hypothetical protein
MTTTGQAMTVDGATLDELQAEVRRLRAELDDIAVALTTSFGEPGDAGEPTEATGAAVPAPIQPVYETLQSWVNDYYLAVFPRPATGEARWCSQWEDHPEAVTRLEALWRSWETLRLDPNLGIATWLTTYRDPLTAQLVARPGTFAACAPTRHAGQTNGTSLLS